MGQLARPRAHPIDLGVAADAAIQLVNLVWHVAQLEP